MTFTLDFAAAVRHGEKYGNGSYKSERRFYDVVVNGSSLWERLGRSRDLVSVLCSEFLPETLNAVDRLLLRSEADVPNDRRSLFVCAECGDIGCGAVTLSVRRVGGTAVWSDFGYENNYEEQVLRDDYRNVGPFEFDWSQYESAFLKVIAQLKPG